MKKILALVLAAVMLLSLTACGGGAETEAPAAEAPANNEAAAPAAPAEPIALTLWGGEEDQNLLAELVEDFKAAYPDQTFDIQIGVESESTAKDTILTDVEAGADVFAFANDQINELIAAGALLQLDGDMAQVLPAYAGKSIDDVKAANSTASIETATRGGKMPYMLVVTGPALITDFVKNVNNFNVIYLLTQDVFITTDQAMANSQAREVDLLVTWLFNLTQNYYNYKMASVIGIMVFIVCALFTLIAFNAMNNGKEEGYQ